MQQVLLDIQMEKSMVCVECYKQNYTNKLEMVNTTSQMYASMELNANACNYYSITRDMVGAFLISDFDPETCPFIEAKL